MQADRRQRARRQLARLRAQLEIDAIDAQHRGVHERPVGPGEEQLVARIERGGELLAPLGGGLAHVVGIGRRGPVLE